MMNQMIYSNVNFLLLICLNKFLFSTPALQSLVSVLSKNGISLQTGAKQNSEPVQSAITPSDQVDRIKPFKFVTLWPLFEHMSLLTEFTLDVKSLMEAQPSSDCHQPVSQSSTAACRGYVLSHTPNVVAPNSYCVSAPS